MLIHQRYNDVKAGTCSKENFLAEARRDDRVGKFITGFTTFDEAIALLKAKGYLFEEDAKPAKKFSVTDWMKESISDEINEPKETVHPEAVNAFEFEKGWRYEIKKMGKYEEEDIKKAKDKAIKNLEKDELHYTKLEMQGAYPDDKGHKDLDISKGDNKKDPDNQSKPVKVKKGEATDTQKYVDDMYDRGKAPKKHINEAEAQPQPKSGFTSEDQKCFVVDMATGKIVKGFEDVMKATEYAEELNGSVKPTMKSGYMAFRTKDLNGIGLNHRDKNNWKDVKADTPADKTLLQKLKDLFSKAVKEGSALDDLTKSHQNDKNPLITREEKDPENKLPGGKGDKLSAADVDQKEFSLGLSVESEHTDDPEIAKEIVLDHLAEDPHYYTKLAQLGLEEKVAQLKESIRKVVRAKLLKEFTYVPEPSGPDVDRKELKRELQGVTWPSVGSTDTDGNYPDNGYRKRINSEKVMKIKQMIDRLGQEGIDLYNEYAPDGCKWGEPNDLFSVSEESETAEPQIRQDIKDMEDLDPKDLAKMVLDKKFNDNSIKTKAAVKLLGHAIKQGNKDAEVKKAFMMLADKFKK